MSKRIQGIIAGVIVTVLLFSGVAAAATRQETITVTYRDIKIVVDGEVFVPKDVNGKIVEPFLYQGTTYLPVRAVSEALGKEVTWDGAASMVHIEDKDPGIVDGVTSPVHQMIRDIENREVINSVLITYADIEPDLVAQLYKYNELTSILFAFFFAKASNTIANVTAIGFDLNDADFSGEWNTPPVYPFTPEALAESAWRIAIHSLYKDATQRLYADPYFAAVLDKEGGGSAGMWPDYVHNYYDRQDILDMFNDYTELVENLLVTLPEL